MANPRTVYSYHKLNGAYATYPSDVSIVAPVVSFAGYAPAISAQINTAVANTATGTGGPVCGLGADGGALLGKLTVVEPDGACAVQHEGYMYLPYQTGVNVPLPGQPVCVDGTGKVRKSATFLGAMCEGFSALDPEPLNTAAGFAALCIVRK